MPLHPHADMIDRLGRHSVATLYGLSKQRMHRWRTEGIPWTHRAHFAAMASQHADRLGFTLPDDFLKPPDLPSFLSWQGGLPPDEADRLGIPQPDDQHPTEETDVGNADALVGDYEPEAAVPVAPAEPESQS